MDIRFAGSNIMKKIWGFVNRTIEDHVGAYAAQAAYFLILSFIPFILFLTTLIRFTPITYNQIREVIISIIPQDAQAFVMGIVADVYRRNSALVPISALAAIWSAGKGLQAITNGLNTIYHVKETRNWLVNRIKSVFFTILLCVALIVSLLVMVLGRRLSELVREKNEFIGTILMRIMNLRVLPVFVILFLVFWMLFRFLPNRRATFRSQMPGALLTAVSWMLFAYLFSLYFVLFPSFSNMYGSLAALIIVMLWVYFLMNLLLFGALVNTYFEKDFARAEQNIRSRLSQQERTGQDKAETAGKAADSVEENEKLKAVLESEKGLDIPAEDEIR